MAVVAIRRAMLADAEWADKVRCGELAALQPFHPRVLPYVVVRRS